MASVGVAIINWNRLEMLKRCIQSVLETSAGVVFDLFVWDVGSTDGSYEWLSREVSIFDPFDARCDQLCSPPRLSYAQTVNQAARYLFAKYPEMVYFYPLNNDNYVLPGWLSACAETFASDPKIGHVGSCVWYGPSFPQMSGKVQSAGAFFQHGMGGWTTRSAFVGQQTISTVPCCYEVDYNGFGMYRRDLFEKFGGLCEDYPPIYWDDPDWGFTLWSNGYRVVCDLRSMIVHDHTPNPYIEPERQHHFAAIGPNKEKFMARWSHLLLPDGTRSPILPKVVGC